jgi:hypothetical protein
MDKLNNNQEGSKLYRRDFLKTAASPVVAGLASLAHTEKTQIENKLINKDGKWEFVFTSADPEEAHNSANRFANEVGNQIKREYPSIVAEPTLALEVFTSNGQKMYRMTWGCRILKSTPINADYYFDRRGTLLWGRTLDEAKSNVEAEIKKSGKVELMRKKFGSKAKIYSTFIKEAYSGSEAEGYWYIKEFFLTAPK